MASKLTILLFFFFFFFTIALFTPTKAAFNVFDFGAKPGGQTDSAKAFLAAWAAACASPAPATIVVPKGRYLLNKVAFNGPCKSPSIKIQLQGTLVAPSYSVIGTADQWIHFYRIDNLSVFGGTLDGQGSKLWACKLAGRSCPDGAATLVFSGMNNLLINGLTSLNSELAHIVINGCNGVTMQGIMVIAAENSPNTDGLHVQMSTAVTITKATLKTGDDCISIGPGMNGLWIEDVFCGPGHGISIGSLGKDMQEPGVQNVTVTGATFSGTQNGVRIKTWGRPSLGFVKGVRFEHIVMQNVQNPIVITQNYCPTQKNCPGQNSGVKISDVTYNDVQGTSATPVAVNFDCSPSNPCRGIKLQNIKLTYDNKQAQSSCTHAAGTTAGFVVPESCL
ncbi:hypothetical protein QJS04_geneDACA015579 [Acorus gramineus]|uniref:Exopolygalacturonase n=1 Tax=Acorus gramineus TaxID=55184 RepID=A0AAV9AT56_ACOGR|nr:hypothetical protein QJS04_geneDACA015579 [Acorus gramineus]